jgi:iron complex transport system substrate-binding protein
MPAFKWPSATAPRPFCTLDAARHDAMMPSRCRLLPMERAVVRRRIWGSAGAVGILGVVVALGWGCGAESPRTASGAAPSRIVALAPSVTEIVYGLGEGKRVVGVCAQCNHPPAAKRLPRMGGYLAPSVEAVLAVQPDLVLVVPSPGNREAVRTLERAGVRVLVTGDRTLDDLWAAIASIAEALGVPRRGAKMVRRVRDQLDAVRTRVDAFPPARVLLVVGHRPLIVAGGGTLQDELLRVAGGINVAADAGAAFPQVPRELVVARAPEVILDAAMGTEAGGRDLFADLRSVPAVRDGRIVSLPPDALFRAGPRVGAAAAQLAAALHPEAPHS